MADRSRGGSSSGAAKGGSKSGIVPPKVAASPQKPSAPAKPTRESFIKEGVTLGLIYETLSDAVVKEWAKNKGPPAPVQELFNTTAVAYVKGEG